MPWKLASCALLLGACLFDADYRTGTVACSDGKCPSGLVCAMNRCVATLPIDAAHDARLPDALHDGPASALTCADPGPLPMSGGVDGTTVGRTSRISASCGGFVMNGPDAVYKITLGAGVHLLLGTDKLDAYVIAPCSPSPATPACLGNSFATANNPISVTTTFAGNYYIVVDAVSPAASSDYHLTITTN